MKNVAEVLKAGMCTGCGLCVGDPDKIQIDTKGYLRPTQQIEHAIINHACPGKTVIQLNKDSPYDVTWGPILSCQTGRATDVEVRQNGSSGGVITALLLNLLKYNKVDAIIQVGASLIDPLRNTTYVHNSPEAVLANAGSRYAPSAPLSVIQSILGNGNTYAFVGKPCDVSALRAFLQIQPQFKAQFPYLLSFMCAGVPSEQGTVEILGAMNLRREEVKSFRYRGDGWPGLTKASTHAGQSATLTYNESWGNILNRHLQPRCKVCADGTGEAADIVCADAWFESENGYPTFEERDGRSLVLTRTKIGNELLNFSIRTGCVVTEPYQTSDVSKIQPYQENRKRTALARLLALRTLGSYTPFFIGHKLVRASILGGFKANLAAYLGTLHRKVRGRLG